MFVLSEAIDHLDPHDHLVPVTMIWHVEAVEKPLSDANKLWCHTTRGNTHPQVFLDEFIQKIL